MISVLPLEEGHRDLQMGEHISGAQCEIRISPALGKRPCSCTFPDFSFLKVGPWKHLSRDVSWKCLDPSVEMGVSSMAGR